MMDVWMLGAPMGGTYFILHSSTIKSLHGLPWHFTILLPLLLVGFMTNGKIFGRLKMKEVQLKEKLKVLDEIVSDSDHREFVSAGW